MVFVSCARAPETQALGIDSKPDVAVAENMRSLERTKRIGFREGHSRSCKHHHRLLEVLVGVCGRKVVAVHERKEALAQECVGLARVHQRCVAVEERAQAR